MPAPLLTLDRIAHLRLAVDAGATLGAVDALTLRRANARALDELRSVLAALEGHASMFDASGVVA